ncbi:MAG: hypothetical protein ACT4OZ_05140 [Gemmatimonadota bacterium]
MWADNAQRDRIFAMIGTSSPHLVRAARGDRSRGVLFGLALLLATALLAIRAFLG